MVFSSYAFLLLFLPLVYISYQVSARYLKLHFTVVILILFSWLFYAVWNWYYLPLLLGSIALNYCMGRALSNGASKRVLYIGVGLNLLLLIFFKYTDFIANNLLSTDGLSYVSLALPLAISFFTFQQIAWLFDCHRGLIRQVSALDYCFFVSFFPQLIAGPIVHAREVIPQIGNIRNAADHAAIISGVTLFSIGLAKKVLLADTLAPEVDRLFLQDAAGLDLMLVLAAGCAYGLQLYFDFSGYADMAIGLGLMFGIRLPENFNSPYKASSITDFWRRWHITLSNFLRDYLYIPLGGSREGHVRTLLALLATMLLGGLWHGAGWQFILWGFLHGMMLALHRLLKLFTGIALPRVVAVCITFLLISVAWISFRAVSIEHALQMYRAMGHVNPGSLLQLFGQQPLFAVASLDISGHLGWGVLLGILIVWALPNARRLEGRLLPWQKGFLSGALLFMVLKSLTERPLREFLYFNF